MTIRDLLQLGNGPDTEIWLSDEEEQRLVPTKFDRESIRRGEPIIVITKQTWAERGGDIL